MITNVAFLLLEQKDKGVIRLSGILEFLFRKKEGLRPDAAVPALKTDLRALDRDSNRLAVYVKLSQVYLKQEVYKKNEVDALFSPYIKKDGTTPFVKAQLGVPPGTGPRSVLSSAQ